MTEDPILLQICNNVDDQFVFYCEAGKLHFHVDDELIFKCLREELEKQQAKEKYMKAHLAGKTEEARADLARLALIRKQREEAARKREEERIGD